MASGQRLPVGSPAAGGGGQGRRGRAREDVLQGHFPDGLPGIAVATLYTFLGSMEEARGTMLVGLGKIQTMPVAMYGIVLDSSAVQIGAVFAILLIIPSAVMIFAMRRYIGPEAISGGFKMK